MNETVMILGGDLFSLLVSRILNRLGMKVIWVSCRQSYKTNYGRELDQVLMNSSSIRSRLDYLYLDTDRHKEMTSLPESISILEDASLVNFLDNGASVKVRIKVHQRTENYKCDYLISTNRYFSLHKKLGLCYETTPKGPQLSSMSLSRCHFIGEVTYLYFRADQIEEWFIQLNRFIKNIRSEKGTIPNRQKYLRDLMSSTFSK